VSFAGKAKVQKKPTVGILQQDLVATNLICAAVEGQVCHLFAIADHLHSIGLPYHYEQPLLGTAVPGRLRPDFSFIDDAGNIVVWEHLGMLNRADYRKGWEWKQGWYKRNGFVEGVNLFTTSEEKGLDMTPVMETANVIPTITAIHSLDRCDLPPKN